MPPDSAATRKRLMQAALAEFSTHGLAGARIDRIAERAGANKRLLYVYFGNKEELFDLVIELHLEELANAVPFLAEDLPAYAGDLFDHLLERPELMRLAIWQQLERPEARPREMAAYAHKVEAIGQAQAAGLIRPDPDPLDLIVQVIGLTTAWLTASPALRELGGPDQFASDRLADHRRALIAAVARLTSLD